MMKRLEGRSLAHPGCLIGITLGLIFGIILGGVLASVFNVELNIVMLIWLALTLVLGVAGWLIGERLSHKFRLPTLQEEQPAGAQSEAQDTP